MTVLWLLSLVVHVVNLIARPGPQVLLDFVVSCLDVVHCSFRQVNRFTSNMLAFWQLDNWTFRRLRGFELRCFVIEMSWLRLRVPTATGETKVVSIGSDQWHTLHLHFLLQFSF